jgi:hypothetical protein
MSVLLWPRTTRMVIAQTVFTDDGDEGDIDGADEIVMARDLFRISLIWLDLRNPLSIYLSIYLPNPVKGREASGQLRPGTNRSTLIARPTCSWP